MWSRLCQNKSIICWYAQESKDAQTNTIYYPDDNKLYDTRYKQKLNVQTLDLDPPSVQLLSLQLIGDWPCPRNWIGCRSLPCGSPVHMVNIKYASMTINASLPVWNTDTATTLVNAGGIHIDNGKGIIYAEASYQLAHWLRRYATNRKVAGSIPDEVNF
jgi:hypothetical protein